MFDLFVIAVDSFKVEIDEDSLGRIHDYTIVAKNFFYDGKHQKFKVFKFSLLFLYFLFSSEIGRTFHLPVFFQSSTVKIPHDREMLRKKYPYFTITLKTDTNSLKLLNLISS